MALFSALQKFITKDGQPVEGASVLVKLAGSATAATLYATRDGGAKGNPFFTPANGEALCYVSPGRYDMTVTFNAEQVTFADVEVGPVSNIGTFASGGVITDPDQLVEDNDGNKWRWTGALNYTFAPGEDPELVAGWVKWVNGPPAVASAIAAAILESEQALAAVDSDKLIGGQLAGNIAKRSLAWRTPAEFGAAGDGGDYSTELQAAFDSGFPIIFDKDYTAAHVKIRGENKLINFNGYSLQPPTGSKVTAEDYLLDITCRASTLYLIKVNVAFKPYLGAIRWHSLSVGNPSNNNKIYGMTPIYCIYGLVYGNIEGSPVVDAPHSENTVFGFNCRGVKVPFYGNQTNGFITFNSPIFDCNPNEWAGQAGYDATEWGNNSMAFYNNPSNSLKIIGGELLKTFSQLGVGYEGGNFRLIGVTNECAGTRCNFTGDAQIVAEDGGFMSSDSAPMYTCETGATGVVSIIGGKCTRADGVSSYSGASLIVNNAGNGFRFSIKDSYYYEWLPSNRGTAKADYNNVTFARNGFADIVFGAETALNQTMTPINSWSAIRPVVASRTQAGRVQLVGIVGGGTSGTIAFTLPDGYRPSAQLLFTISAEASGGSIFTANAYVNADGNVVIVSPSTNEFIHLQQIEFITL